MTFRAGTVRLTTVLLTFIAAFTGLFLLTGAAHAQETITWVGAGDGTSWEDPGNWDLRRTPTLEDHVILNHEYVEAPYTVVVSIGQEGLGRLTLDGEAATLDIQNEQGILTEDLVLNDGTITGPGRLMVNRAVTWTGGAFEGEGLTEFYGEVLITGAGPHALRDRYLNLYGPTTLTAESAGVPLTITTNGASVNNQGAFEIESGDVAVRTEEGGEALLFHNSELLRKTGEGEARLEAVFGIGGTLSVEGGQLTLLLRDELIGDGHWFSGELTLEQDATLELQGQSPETYFPFGETMITGAGALHFNQGDYLFQSGVYDLETGATHLSRGAELVVQGTPVIEHYGQLSITGGAELNHNPANPDYPLTYASSLGLEDATLGLGSDLLVTGEAVLSGGEVLRQYNEGWSIGRLILEGITSWEGTTLANREVVFNGSLAIAGGGQISRGTVEEQTEIHLHGSTTWTSGDIVVESGSFVHNHGIFDIQSDVQLIDNGSGEDTGFINHGSEGEPAPETTGDDSPSSFSAQVQAYDTDPALVTEEPVSVIRRSTSAGTATLSVPFLNGGLVDVESGTLALAAAPPHEQSGDLEQIHPQTGHFSVDAGATLSFESPATPFILGAESEVLGEGTVRIGGMRVEVQGAYDVTGGTVFFEGSHQVFGESAAEQYGDLSIEGGASVRLNSGLDHEAAHLQLDDESWLMLERPITTSGYTQSGGYLSGEELENTGPMQWSGGVIQNRRVRTYGPATIDGASEKRLGLPEGDIHTGLYLNDTTNWTEGDITMLGQARIYAQTRAEDEFVIGPDAGDVLVEYGTPRMVFATTLRKQGDQSVTLEPDVENWQTFSIESGTLSMRGGFANIHGEVGPASIRGAGTLDVTDATTFDNQGVVAPGLSPTEPARLTVLGNYNSGSGLGISLAGPTAREDYSQLVVSSGASLSGNLQVHLADGYIPEDGQEYVIFMSEALEGTFEEVDWQNLPEGVTFEVEYDLEEVRLIAHNEREEEPEPPIARNDTTETVVDTPIEIDVLANDEDPQGRELTVVDLTQPQHGEATIVERGSVRYGPERGFTGEDYFDYVVSNGELTDTARVFVNVYDVETHFRITDLGTLGGATSMALDVNDRGVVTGLSLTEGGALRAFIWEDGSMRPVDVPEALETQAFAVSPEGYVAGMALRPDSSARAFLAGLDGATVDLGTLGGDFSIAYGLSGPEHVVGTSTLSDQHTHHAFSHEGSSMTDLGAFDAAHSTAFAVNNEGIVAGHVQYDDGTTRAFLGGEVREEGEASRTYALNIASTAAGSVREGATIAAHLWHADGTSTSLEGLGGSFSEAYDLNDRGWAVGTSTGASAAQSYDTAPASLEQAVESSNLVERWTDDPLFAFHPTRATSPASSTGEDGTLALSATTAITTRAVLWMEGNTHDLNDLIPQNSGWELHEARAINRTGHIVGYGTVDGTTRAFLLSPTDAHPVAHNHRMEAKAGQPLTIDVFGTAERTIASLTEPHHGSAEVSDDGRSVIYTAERGFEGTDTFSYTAESAQGGASESGTVTVEVRAGIEPPETLELLAPYPNPFRTQAHIEYHLPERGEVTLEIFNPIGQRVTTLASGAQEAGLQRATFDAQGLPSGVYFCRLQWEDQQRTCQIVLVR